MSLKTNYKNDAWEGKRKYLLTENDDGTISLDDVTNYTIIGDIFNGDDINATNTAVNANAQGLVTERNTTNQQITAERNTTNQQIQATNAQVNNANAKADALKMVRYATFPASGWSSSAPYSQTVSVSGIESSDNPIVSLYIPSSTAVGSVKGISKAYGCVDRGVTGNGNITLYCYNSKPAVNFQIMIKGE